MDAKIKNTLSIIAFLDILGGKNMIIKDDDASLNLVHNSYTESIKKYKELGNQRFQIPQINIFSDNISISFPIDKNLDNVCECIFSVIFFCSILTLQFTINGLLIRGGITIGYCFSDAIMVWGKALVRAYEIESTIAIYPRIVIDPLADEVFHFLSKSKYQKLICKDFDGLYFIDIFYSQQNHEVLSLLEGLIHNIENSIGKLDDKNLKERQKLQWLQNYYCEKYNYIKNNIKS